MSTEFRHDPELKRYSMHVGGELVSVLEYRDHGASVVMHHTVTVPRHRGRGFAAKLVEHAVDDVASRDGRITPTCWFVAEWFDRHPERAGLLAGS
ncbi:GNAT family N-acetyltransferase [Homoserinibacter sp. YIM 151385]|uniref:GNAT family N-acetyltransferase n=1 Tax=Homoserinibacter sp. YIM 151385 TaxID=2985506 RepID=UPI0022F13FE7|nr:GNAT family N-acetyltransferase [Homoserinibacter sp. YIM 151385]WBU38772.1 GNAT family N-acetyltransferase [Homoserinibacter sp. YIM 151385]